MSPIVAPPVEECDAGNLPAIVAAPVRMFAAGAAADVRRGAWAWLASGATHVAAFGCLTYYAADFPADALPVQPGRASVAVVASAPASNRHDFAAAVDLAPEFPRFEPDLTDPFEPRATPPERTPTTPTPPSAEPPVEVTLDEADFVVRLPARSQEREEYADTDEPTPPTIERTPPIETAVLPDPKAEGLDRLDRLASIASQAADGADVDTLPSQFPSNPAPPYPADALQAGQEGRVMLRVVISPYGTADSVTVDASSGVPSLDASAVATVRRWRFSPARRRGVAVRSEVKIPVRFTIRGVERD